jgi:hypothetical protein
MPLPALYADAEYEEMVCRTMKAIQVLDDEIVPTTPEWMIALLRDRLRDGLTERERMIAWARGGDVLAHKALLLEFRELTDNHILAPASLNDYVGKPDLHPRDKGGVGWFVNFRRDAQIALLVYLTCRYYKIAATRNSESSHKRSRKHCAAAVVADALNRSGRGPIKEKTVANVCARRPPLPSVWYTATEAIKRLDP